MDPIREIPHDQITPEPGQPRQDFDQAALDLLAESMRAERAHILARGGRESEAIHEPIIVRAVGPNRYRLINGERRWRAAALAGITHIPCRVRDVDSYVDLRVLQFEANNSRPLTPLERGQVFYNAWLAANVRALAEEAGQDDPTATLLDADKRPGAEQQFLEEQLVALTGTTVAAYLTSGKVRVPQRDILRRLEWELSASALKRLLDPVKHLDAEVKDAMLQAGIAPSVRTMNDLAKQPAHVQQAIVAAALAGAEDVATAIRSGLGAATGDAAGGVEVRPPERAEQDPARAMRTTSGGTAPMLRVDGPAPARGSVPPVGHAAFTDDDNLRLTGVLEAVLTTLDDIGPRHIPEAYGRAIGIMISEIVERLASQGIAIAIPR